MSFSDLKKNRKSQFEKLAKYAENVDVQQNNKPAADERYWSLTVDDAGNGSAIIRFLPAPEGEDLPFQRYWSHAFRGPGGWYIEWSRTTLGEEDPLSVLNKQMWNDESVPRDVLEQNRKIVSSRKRSLNYVSNIYIVKDPANPSNEGKVFLFRYGKKIYDYLNDAMHPQFDDVDPINPFDLWEGANFRLRAITTKGDNGKKYRNYDRSEFDRPAPLSSNDSDLEEIWNSQHSLAAEVAPQKFKSYEQLQKRLEEVLKVKNNPSAATAEDDELPTQAAWTPPTEAKPKTRPVAESQDDEDESLPFDPDDDDESLDFFKKLASQ